MAVEARATNITNDAGVPSSDPRINDLFSLFGMRSASGVAVNTQTALGVPAVWAAVNFTAGTIAGLPLNVYRRRGEDRVKVSGALQSLLHDAVNPELSSFDWRKNEFEKVFTGGRSFTWIEKNEAGNPLDLWPLDPKYMTVKRENMRKRYEYKEPGQRAKIYNAAEIIDVSFMMHEDGLRHRGPIATNSDAIGLAIAAAGYGSRLFQNGGVPPFAVTGAFQSGQALNRASDDLQEAVKKATKDGRLALTLPAGLEIKPIGLDPEKSQLVELQRFCVEQIARIYSIPPTFLQDLTHGTFSNTEQQDLHFVKHTIKRWVEQFEQELNLKLFGRGRASRFAEMNLDGLMRGDFAGRMQGYALGIQNGIIKPNEARQKENWAADADGDGLFMQGAMAPIRELQNGEP